jgi:hypothetical protein
MEYFWDVHIYFLIYLIADITTSFSSQLLWLLSPRCFSLPLRELLGDLSFMTAICGLMLYVRVSLRFILILCYIKSIIDSLLIGYKVLYFIIEFYW